MTQLGAGDARDDERRGEPGGLRCAERVLRYVATLPRRDRRVSDAGRRALVTQVTEHMQTARRRTALDELTEAVAQRLAARLLDLAEPGPRNKLVVRASQQQLADAVGSVREVVTRALHDLREAGLVDTRRDEIIVLDAAHLAERASGPRRQLPEPRPASWRARNRVPAERRAATRG